MENTKTGKDNFYINRLENWISQFGKEKALQRGIQNLCGLFLSKNFGETSENFFNRKPEILEYKEFINSLKS